MGLKNYFLDFQRTPAPSSGLPMNSMPAVSKAFCIESSVLACAAGTPSPVSKRIRVENATPEASASSFPVHLSNERAARI